MASQRGSRDRRFSRTFGTKPHVGRRYVIGDKVRIEWTEGARRRSRTIGGNSLRTRREADQALEDILERLVSGSDQSASEEEEGQEQPLREAARVTLLALLDLADLVAARVERTVGRWVERRD
jgi:hypothetical protein